MTAFVLAVKFHKYIVLLGELLQARVFESY